MPDRPAASGAGDPGSVAGGVVAGSAGSITSNVSVSAGGDAASVTVTVSADVLGVFPIGSYSASASASAPIQRFILSPSARETPTRPSPQRTRGFRPARDGHPAARACCCCSAWWWRSGGRRRPTPTSSTPRGSAPGRRPSAQTSGRRPARWRAPSSPTVSAAPAWPVPSGPSVAVGGPWAPGGRVTVTVSCTASLGDVTKFGAPGRADADRNGDRGDRPHARRCAVSAARGDGRARQRVVAGRDHGAGPSFRRRGLGPRRWPPAGGPPRGQQGVAASRRPAAAGQMSEQEAYGRSARPRPRHRSGRGPPWPAAGHAGSITVGGRPGDGDGRPSGAQPRAARGSAGSQGVELGVGRMNGIVAGRCRDVTSRLLPGAIGAGLVTAGSPPRRPSRWRLSMSVGNPWPGRSRLELERRHGRWSSGSSPSWSGSSGSGS